MKKLTLLCLSPLVFANLALAGGMNAPAYSHPAKHAGSPRYFNGFSVTGALGGMTADLDANHDFNSVVEFSGHFGVADLTVSHHNDLDLSEDSFVGYIGLDYAYQWSNGFLLGVGVTAGFDNLNFLNVEESFDNFGENLAGELATNVSVLKVELENDFAILFKPGYVVRHNTLIYALVGPRWGNIETSLHDSYAIEAGAFVGPELDFREEGSDVNAEYHMGVTAGVGIQQMIARHVKLGLEYAYTHYGDLDSLSVSHVLFETGSGGQGQLTASDAYSDMSLTTHTVMGTLSYQF